MERQTNLFKDVRPEPDYVTLFNPNRLKSLINPFVQNCTPYEPYKLSIFTVILTTKP